SADEQDDQADSEQPLVLAGIPGKQKRRGGQTKQHQKPPRGGKKKVAHKDSTFRRRTSDKEVRLTLQPRADDCNVRSISSLRPSGRLALPGEPRRAVGAR